MKVLTGWQIREQYKNDRRDFSNTEIQWADFSNTNLSGINFSGSKLSIITFYGCDLEGADFFDCEVYGTSFNSANLSRANFDKSRLNWVRFDNAVFNNTTMRNAHLTHATMINCATAELKTNGTAASNVFYRAPEIPESEIQLLLQEIGSVIQKADLDRKLWVRTSIAHYLREIGKKAQIPNMDTYSKESSPYSQASGLYQGIENVLKELIETYGAKNPYAKESRYKAKRKY